MVRKEASILSQLKHPHIVFLFESFIDEAEEFLYIVQDYCDDGTLDDKIIEMRKKNNFFDEKQIMHWFVQIVMGVQYIHSKKVLHRDLKTENVFLTKKNVLKIGDFGISKMLDNTIDLAKTVVGTPTYLSPELCQDIPYSSKSDIWVCFSYLFLSLMDASNSLHKCLNVCNKNTLPEHLAKIYVVLTGLALAQISFSPVARGDASAILNRSLIQDHLTLFIEETRCLIQQKNGKDTSNLSHVSDHTPSKANSSNSLKPSDSGHAGVNKRHHSPSGKLSPHHLSPAVRRREHRSSPGGNDSRQRSGGSSPCGRSPCQEDSGLAVSSHEDVTNVENSAVGIDLSDYSDDFDSSQSEIEEDIEVDLTDAAFGEESGDMDYDDDFEEYNSEEVSLYLFQYRYRCLCVTVRNIRSQQMLRIYPILFSSYCRQCMEACGGREFEDMKRLIDEGKFTEKDIKLEVRRSIGEEAIEICHFDMEDLPTG
ncbi:hypothetical protein ScPMuIL_015490 [Solemya velum]